MTTDQTKPCRMCCQPIPAGARKCPYCQHLQSALQAFFHNPGAQVLLGAGVALIGLVVFVLVMSRVFDDPGREFCDFKDQLHIRETRTEFGKSREQDVIVVIGFIQNDSPVSWSRPSMEFLFRDEQGRVTDSKQMSGPGLVLRRDKTAFSVTIPRLFGEEKYATHEVRILDARETRRGFVD